MAEILQIVIKGKDEASPAVNKIGDGLDALADQMKLTAKATAMLETATKKGFTPLLNAKGGLSQLETVLEQFGKTLYESGGISEEAADAYEAAFDALDEFNEALDDNVIDGKAANDAMDRLKDSLQLLDKEFLDVAKTTGNYRDAMGRLRNENGKLIKDTEKVTDTSHKASTALDKIKAAAGNAADGLRSLASGAADKASTALSGVASAAAGLATGGLIAAAAAITGVAVAGAGLVKGGLDINSSMEQVRAQLLAMTKDGALTEKILNDIRTEASLTPFAFEEMAKATAGLMPAAKAANMDLMELVKTAEILAASNPAEGLEGAAFALREAAGGDLASVIERFNLPRQRLNELKEQGVPAIKAVQIAMGELGLDAGLVGNMAQTMTGRWSTFNDTIDTLKSTMSQPLFDLLKEGLTNMQVALDANMPKLQEIAGLIGQKLADGLRGVGEVIGRITPLVTGFFMVLANGDIQAFADTARNLFGSNIGNMMSDFAQTLKGVGDAIWYIGSVLQGGDPLNGYLFDMQYSLSEVFGSGLANAAVEMLKAIGDSVVYVQNAIYGFQTGGVGGLVQMLGLNDEQHALLVRWLALFLELKDRVTAFAESAWAAVSEQMGKVKEWFDTNLPLIQAVISQVLGEIQAYWSEHGDAIFAIVSNIFQGAWNIISTVLGLIGGAIQFALQTWNGDFDGALKTLGEMVWLAWEGIKKLFELALNMVWQVLKEMWPDIEKWWDGSLKGFVKLVTNLATSLFDAGKALIENLQRGIEQQWASLSTWFSQKLQGLRDLLPGSEPKDSSSPLFGLGKSGEALVKNFAVGIDGAASIAVGAVRRMGVQVARAVTEVAQESIRPLVNIMFPQLGAGLDGLTTGTDALTSAMQVMANQSTSAFGQMATAAGQAAAAVGNVTRELHLGGVMGADGQWRPSRNPRPDADGRTKPQRRGRWVSRQQPDGTYRREWEESGGGGGSIPNPDTSPPTKPFSDFQVPSPSTGGDAGTGGGATNLVETILAALRKAKDESLLGAGNSINLTANYPAESQVSLIDRTKMLSAIMGG